MSASHWIMLALVWLTDFTLFMVVFAVSRGLAETGSNSIVLGLAGGGFSLAIGLSSLIGGRVSDRVGRFPLILAGVVGILVGTWGCLAAGPEIRHLVPAYILVGASAGLIFPSTVALLSHGSDAVADRSGVIRTLVAYCIAWNGGLISGQLTGGWLYDQDPIRPLQVAGVLAAINPLLLWAAARRQSHRSPTRMPNAVADQEHRATSAAFSRLAWMANLGGTFAMSMVLHLFPLLMVELDIPPGEHGGLLAINRVAVVMTYLIMHRVQFWHHRFWTAALSQILAAASLLVLAAADTRLGIIVGLVGLAQLVGYNFFASIYYSTTGVTEERRGAASGIHEFTLAIGFAAGAVGGGYLGHLSGNRAPYQLAAAVIVALLIVQALTLASYRKRHQREAETGSAAS